MSRKSILETEEMLRRLERCGITREDAETLRRISMTLHRWHEMECGIDNGCIERDEKTGATFWLNSHNGRRFAYPDREKGALKRLAAVMKRYPGLSTYVQGDPRGAALYVLRDGDVPEGCDVGAYYSRGLAVYK